jgi:peptidyl-tRNA hydrolase
MKVILALGNPGEKYAYTRHNAGFLVVDQLAAEQGAHFSNKPKFFADIAELNSFTVNSAANAKPPVTIPREKILLVKPTTYYNEVGISARAIYRCGDVNNFRIVVRGRYRSKLALCGLIWRNHWAELLPADTFCC